MITAREAADAIAQFIERNPCQGRAAMILGAAISSTRFSALERGEAEPKQWEVEAAEKLLSQLPRSIRVRE